MADNVPIDPSTAPTAVDVATDEIGGRHYQIVKPAFGPADAAQMVDAAHGLPVATGLAQPLTDAQLRAAPLPLPDGAASEATLAALSEIVQSVNDLSDTMLQLLSAMLEKMPRLTADDRVTVAIQSSAGSEINSAYYPFNTGFVGEPASGRLMYRMLEPWNFADAGAARIYQNITVS